MQIANLFDVRLKVVASDSLTWKIRAWKKGDFIEQICSNIGLFYNIA